MFGREVGRMDARHAPLHRKVRVGPSIDGSIRAAAVKNLKPALSFGQALMNKYFETVHSVDPF
jgi:hypothetical protein